MKTLSQLIKEQVEKMLRRWRDMGWVHSDPDIMGGDEVISGTRLPVSLFTDDIESAFETIARKTAESLRVEKRYRFEKHPRDITAEYTLGHNEGFNAALTKIGGKKREFFKGVEMEKT